MARELCWNGNLYCGYEMGWSGKSYGGRRPHGSALSLEEPTFGVGERCDSKRLGCGDQVPGRNVVVLPHTAQEGLKKAGGGFGVSQREPRRQQRRQKAGPFP